MSRPADCQAIKCTRDTHLHWCAKPNGHRGPHLCGAYRCRKAWAVHKASALQQYLLKVAS